MRWFSLAAILLLTLAWLPTTPNSYSEVYRPFSDAELDQLLAPIALYPDPLLAQILPAASFGDQIYRASSMLDGHVDEGLIEIQNWDISVKALAHYPNVLSFMAQSPDWTAAVGQAYVTQRRAVERSIQRLREQARAAGYLQSTDQQQVIVDDVIRIEPAQADAIYVPQYDPGYIWGYSDLYPYSLYPYPAYPYGGIGFGAGLFIGPWLNRDWDWFGAGPYYHGWRGRGWVGRSRQFVDTRNRSYVNDQFRNVHVNRDVVKRNTGDIRARMDRNASIRQKPQANPPAAGAPPRATPPSRVVTPPGASAPRTGMPPPAATTAPRAVTPAPPATSAPARAKPAPPTATPTQPPRAPSPTPRATTPVPPATSAPASAKPAPQTAPPPPSAAVPAPHAAPPPPPAAVPAPHAAPPPPPAAMPAPHAAPPPPPAAVPAPHAAPPPPPAAMPAPHAAPPPPPAAMPAPHAAPPPPPPAAAPHR